MNARRLPLSKVRQGQTFRLYEGGAAFRSTGETKYMDHEIHVLFERDGAKEERLRAMPYCALVWVEE